MLVAIDKDFTRIHIESAVAKQECYCPYCGEPLVQRKGEIKRHHFSHKPKSVCRDTWASTYDMSDWHYDWQNSVPKDNQEVMLTLGDIKHRADVLIGRTVTEFQRNNMSSKVFSDRNNFYLSKTDTKEFVSAMESAFGKLAKELHTISVDDVMTIMGYSISWTNLPNLK